MLLDKPGDVNFKALTFDEMDEGFNAKEAISEAKRCLNCPKPLCRTGCPIENDIPNFINALSKGNIGEASKIIATRSNLPAVCGRVCPHEKQCEAACILAKKGKEIKIGKLERFIADFDAEMEISPPVKRGLAKGKVAVIGSGPAGLTVAGDLAKLGFSVTVFEAEPEAGGVLMYGIPNFRLNKDVVRREVRRIESLGVEIKTQILVGRDITVDDMFKDGFDAIFIGTGTALAKELDLPGKNLPGVMQAIYFLRTIVLANAKSINPAEIPVNAGDRVVVIGAGNVAMDAARSALRFGAEQVTIVYRRGEDSMTALKSEYEDAKAEGVQFHWFLGPVKYLGEEKLTGLECDRYVQNENGLECIGQEIIAADKVILAVGQRPASRIVSTTTGIDVNPNGFLIIKDKPYGMSSKVGVFAGGDVVHEPATVVLAMKEAKKVAAGIALYVEAKRLMQECGLELPW